MGNNNNVCYDVTYKSIFLTRKIETYDEIPFNILQLN